MVLSEVVPTLYVQPRQGLQGSHEASSDYQQDRCRMEICTIGLSTQPSLTSSLLRTTAQTRDRFFSPNFRAKLNTSSVAIRSSSFSLQTSWLEQNVSGVVLVQIIDHPIKHNRTTLLQVEERFRSLGNRGWQWLNTPVHAVRSAREATMSFQNDLKKSMSQNQATLCRPIPDLERGLFRSR